MSGGQFVGPPEHRLQLRGRTLLLAVSVLASLGFMLVGYNNELMGGLVDSPAFNRTFGSPKPRMVGLIVAIFEIGCFLGAIGAAISGEQLGRRRTIGHGCGIMLAGAALQATSSGRVQLIVGRVVSGMGFVNSTVPVLQAEFSPKASRGTCVRPAVDAEPGHFPRLLDQLRPRLPHWQLHAWRIPVVLQCFYILAILAILPLIPETPRWLAAHDRPDECLEVLARMRAAPTDDGEVRRMHSSILHSAVAEPPLGSGSWRDLVDNDQVQSQRRLLLACAIQTFQQLGGINAVIYYANTLFQKSVGFGLRASALMLGYLQTWFFVASFIPWFLIDRIGRKPLFLSMISVMACVMAVQAGLIYQVEHKTAVARRAGIAAAAMLFVFQGAFTVGFQATVWVYPYEILPLRLRQRGSSLSTAANWIFNYMIVQMTPIAIERLGWTYIIFAVLNTAWVPLVFFFPETKGLESWKTWIASLRGDLWPTTP